MVNCKNTPFVSGLYVFPFTNVLTDVLESWKEATKSANTSAHSASSFCRFERNRDED